MLIVSRRHVLRAFGTAALMYGLRPFHVNAGLLDRLFGHEGRKTKPITPNEEFYVTSYRSPPTIRVHDWSLTVKGLVNRPFELTYEQLIEKPAVSPIVTLECVGNTIGGESISTAEWTGVPLRSLLEESGISDQAYDVVFRAADEFSDSITLDRAVMGDVIIAYKMNGVPLPEGHGFPARAIVPGQYGMKSVQWLTEIELVDYDYKGYYPKKGWTEAAVVKTMSRIDLPGHGTSLLGLQQKIEGLGFAGSRGIRLVEISTDGGSHWSPANLGTPLSPYAWVFWNYEWTVPAPGRYTLQVRATDGTGSLQTSAEQDSSPDGASGLHEITVTVTA